MEIKSFEIEGFRSLRDLGAKVGSLTVLVGPNGVGKSNLYRGLELLKRACERRLSRTIAAEGGISSVMWAGARLKNKKREVRIQVEWDELEYELIIGASSPDRRSPFPEDPYIKTEKIWSRIGRRVEVVRRAAQVMKYRDDQGLWRTYPPNLAINESMLGQLREPQKFPICLRLQNVISQWRFYHTFRTDTDSFLRQPQPVYRTGSLDGDGGNLAATLLSILEGKNGPQLRKVLTRAFPNSDLKIEQVGSRTIQRVGLMMPKLNRTFSGVEISDGTLRFYALAAALLGEEPPEFLVLNEPETSLHPSTFPALAEAIHYATNESQVLVVTHSRELAREIKRQQDVPVRTLRWDEKRGTRIDDQLRIDEPLEDEDFLQSNNDDPYDVEMNEQEKDV